MFAYGVNTSELQATFASKDETLLAEVQKNEIFQNYAEEDENNAFTLTGIHRIEAPSVTGGVYCADKDA